MMMAKHLAVGAIHSSEHTRLAACVTASMRCTSFKRLAWPTNLLYHSKHVHAAIITHGKVTLTGSSVHHVTNPNAATDSKIANNADEAASTNAERTKAIIVLGVSISGPITWNTDTLHYQRVGNAIIR